MEEPKIDEGQSSGESPLVTPSETNFELRSRMDDVAYSPEAVGSRALDSPGTLQRMKEFNASKGIIDTAQPFDSVKSAVSKFGGVVGWKAIKVMAAEKTTHVPSELDKALEDISRYKKQSEAAKVARDQVLEELGSTRKLIEELKDSLEKTATEEVQAKQDAELAQLRIKEMEQGISDSASTAAKAQLEVAKARHEAAIEELKSVEEELEALQGDYHRLVSERNSAVASAEEAVSAAKNSEKKAEDLTLELIATKAALESARTSHLEAEEHRDSLAMIRDQDSHIHEELLLQGQEQLRQLRDQHLPVEELKSKFETASTMLLKLKAELAFYMERKLVKVPEVTGGSEANKDQASVTSILASAEKELEDVKSSIEKTKDRVNCSREAVASLKAELDRETAALTTLRQREGMTSATVSSLKAELSRMQSELELVVTKEKEAREKMEDLPKVLQQANIDVDKAKSVAQLASEELRRAREEDEQAKAGASTMESRLVAALKEIKAARASEALAVATVKAMEEGEQKKNDAAVTTENEAEAPSESKTVTLRLEEYCRLTKAACEAEESADERVISAVEKIKEAKNSEQMDLQKLEDAQKELEEKKEALKAAVEMADKAIERKLAAEQELRDWRSGTVVGRRASDASASHLDMNSLGSPSENSEASKQAPHHMSTVSCPNLFAEPAMPENPRKKMFFPRIVMFLGRKKAQSVK